MANRQQLKLRQRFMNLMENRNYFGEGVKLTLFPNGDGSTLWIGDKHGRNGLRIEAGSGPFGLRVSLAKFIGTVPLTVAGYAFSSSLPELPQTDVHDLTVVQYNHDERSQAGKNWHKYEQLGRINESSDEKVLQECEAIEKTGRQAAIDGKKPEECQHQPNTPPFFHWMAGYYSQLAHPKKDN
jgi:hypothetical protein